MVDNNNWVGGKLSEEDMKKLAKLEGKGKGGEGAQEAERVRLCWVRDPLKHLDFD